ncbi:MAG: alpha-amylase family glycosyl hydrolase [Candidatus Marinimicrobia bacterium]|nr:alpha-amylase family glycosyl hydrolase [Candidatus Neomarinimicrobiota bacterium]
MFLIFSMPLYSNPITTVPPFPTRFDSITVYYEASGGNQELQGAEGPLYAHTGVITDKSTSPTDWRYVVTPWPGEAPGANQEKNTLIPVDQDRYKLVIGNPYDYYHVPETEKILKLAFVFRNADGSLVGRNADGSDIFVPLYEAGLTTVLINPPNTDRYGHPDRSPLFLSSLTDTLKVSFTAAALGVEADSLFLYRNNTRLTAATSDTLMFESRIPSEWQGRSSLHCVAFSNHGICDTLSFTLIVDPSPPRITKPAFLNEGLTVLDNTSAAFTLMAPGKEFVYLIGDFNDWKVEDAFLMNKHVEGNKTYFWMTLQGLDPTTEYAYQYLVDGHIRIGDPYARKILHPLDAYIPDFIYPDLKPYPTSLTDYAVATFQTVSDPYVWQHDDAILPNQTEFVIYELLIRDFLEDRWYQSLIDTLSYLKNLGINAIELMPVIEFSGNDSWGYNSTFYFAPDKAYGTENDLKALVDSCHSAGLAVILDIVLNHAYGECPFVRLYNEGDFGKPLPENPWFNEISPHPMSVGYDFNHDSPYTKELVKQITTYWLETFHVDGYRFDLSKGFTQKYTGNDLSAWSQYDQSRIDILNEYASHIRSVKEDAILILEHYADNDEETVLAHSGFLLWGNMNVPYSQAAMGWLDHSDFNWGYFRNRGWWAMNLVTFMESHDEPRLMYKNYQYGNCIPTYCTKDTLVALERMALNATFFLTIPGPKMIWQFGEIGYDLELPEEEGRTEAQPVLWEYTHDSNRMKLYNVYKNLLKLRKEYPLFRSHETEVSLYTPDQIPDRRIKLSSPDMNAVIVGNFGLTSTTSWPEFHHSGVWYEFFTQESLYVENTAMTFPLEPGEYRLYTDKKLFVPDTTCPVSLEEKVAFPQEFRIKNLYPNPFNSTVQIHMVLPSSLPLNIRVYSLLGQQVYEEKHTNVPVGDYFLALSMNGFPSNVYFLEISQGNHHVIKKMVLLK